MDQVIAWYNYSTREYDYIGAPMIDAQALQYLPLSPPVGQLYNCYRRAGLSILEAMANVLSASCGQESPYPIKEPSHDLA